MVLRYLIFTCLFAALPTLNLQAQAVFRGYLFSQQDSSAIADALITSAAGKTAITDSKGAFAIGLALPTWIDIKHLNFSGRMDVNDNSTGIFYLSMSTYDLEPAEIFFMNRQKFDREFVNGNHPPNLAFKLKKDLRLETVNRTPNTNGIELGSPITALYNKFSKEAKQKRAYDSLMASVELLDSLKSWLRFERISQIIDSEDTATINCFFLFCSFHPEIAYILSEVEVLQRALICAKSFEHLAPCDWPDDLYFLH